MAFVKMVESEEEVEEKEKIEVVIIDIKMPFWSMIIFMVRWALASIPAFIILVFIVNFLLGVLWNL